MNCDFKELNVHERAEFFYVHLYVVLHQLFLKCDFYIKYNVKGRIWINFCKLFSHEMKNILLSIFLNL